MKGYSGFVSSIIIILTLFYGILGGADSLSVNDVAAAQKLLGLHFSGAQCDSMMDELKDNLQNYEKMRGMEIRNSVPPALIFNPLPVGYSFELNQLPIIWGIPHQVTVPDIFDKLAFYSIGQLAELIRTRQITSEALTRLYLKRLKEYDPLLHCVITLTEDSALARARQADREIAAGNYRGPLHGIPYGVKDLLAVRGYKTTWGAGPYREQYLDETATVVRKLNDAGAVLVAKLTMGALAWGDVWFGGQTKNPWDLEQGSSGSSAGSAAATSAGLVAFAIGTETWGSIVSPSTRCGTTGLRPTYGRVSRTGAMALSWSMDKIGPICRTVQDCAIIFDAIRGPDGIDATVVEAPFNYPSEIHWPDLRIGYLHKEFEEDTLWRPQNQAALARLKKWKAQLVPLELPDLPVNAMSIILSAEAATAFDELTRSGRDSLLVRQIKNAWPNVFRASRFIPAVEYLQANRIRTLLIQQMYEIMQQVDLFVAPSFGDNLLATNLTGHPCVVLPNGFDDKGHPVSITFTGQLYDEGTLLAVAKAYQDSTGFQIKHPPLFEAK
jgi:Asp-tRNA(Asn)/Glu-tRNA(Gln) amidotransferase A subunit family amidase